MGAFNVDGDKNVKPTRAVPQRRDTSLSIDEVQSPKRLAQLLSELRQDHADLHADVHGDTMHQRAVFEDVAVSNGGALVYLQHNLNRRVEWMVTRWHRTTPGGTHGIEESEANSDLNTLALVSYIVGTATVRIF